jgi:hypothetical protein
MAPAPLGFLCGCLWFGVFLIGQVVLLRRRKHIKRSRMLIRGISAAALAAMASVALWPMQGGATLLLAEIYALAVLGCLFVLYGPFFYAIHTSLSVESLLLLMESGGRAPLSELTDRFASRRLLEDRLRTMVESGYLSHDGERFAPTPRAERLAMVFAKAKSLWRLGAGG